MKNIPINKGNYSLDTEERNNAFSAKLASGWEEDYRQYRSNWIDCAKNRTLMEYPLLLDLETSSVCNLRCPMCYTITEDFKKKVNATLMDLELYKKIIEEIAGNVPAIRLSLRGEPTLHPDLCCMVRYAKQNNIGEVSFLTNGSRFDSEYVEKLIDAGVDWITLSIDGLGVTYEQIRQPMLFETIIKYTKNITTIKKQRRIVKPVIKIQSIWPAVRNDPAAFYHCFAPYSDLIAFNPLIDYLSMDTDIVYIDDFACPQLYQRLVIGADGTALMCSNDEENANPVGDANKQSIHEIWHGEKLSAVRAAHAKTDGFKNFNACMNCFLPRATSEDEYAEIDGREFCIPNYINRSQIVGE